MKTGQTRLIAFASLIFLLVSAFIACQKNSGGGGIDPGSDPIVDDAVRVTASVRGIVVDENDNPVAGATVYSGSSITLTDSKGVFQFRNVSLSMSNAYISVTRIGYFTAGRSFPAVDGRMHNIRIKMIPKTQSGSFTAASGGTVTLANSAKLVMPAGALVDYAGNNYNATVNVAMTWIDPTSQDLLSRIPGDLRGITSTGQQRGLQTFGMIGVDLTDATGQPLKIATGKTAQLNFPIPSSLAAAAPSTIDLWHFDETKGRWIQDGTATKNANYYTAEVSHFSFWNCDAPFPVVQLCMRVTRADNGEPLVNTLVQIHRNGSPYVGGAGYTDSLGNLCGLVPRNEPLTLEVLDQCGNAAYSQTVGPFSDNTDIGTLSITLNASNFVTITGVVQNCQSGPVTSGAAIVYLDGGYFYPAAVNNGNFSITILKCNSSAASFSVLPIDYASLQQGNIFTGSATTGTINVGTLLACGVAANEHLDLSIDNFTTSYVIPADSILTFSIADTGSYSNRTVVYFSRINNNNNVSFSFKNNKSIGTVPLTQCTVIESGSAIGTSSQIVSPNPQVVISEFGPVGGFIQGSFAIQMKFGSTVRNVGATFRMRHN